MECLREESCPFSCLLPADRCPLLLLTFLWVCTLPPFLPSFSFPQTIGNWLPSSAAKDVAAGHREVTHEVLWRLLMHFQVNLSICPDRLQAEIATIKQRRDYQRNCAARRASEAQMYVNAPAVSLLLQWCRAIGLCFTVEVSDKG